MQRQNELPSKPNMTIGMVLQKSFTEVYPSDSFDSISKEYNGKRVSLIEQEAVYNYFRNPITMITSFLGLPNRCSDGEQQSWSNIGKNLIGWDPEVKPTPKSVFDGFMILPTVLWNLSVSALTTGRNIVKLATELLPRASADLCSYAAKHADYHMYHTKSGVAAELGYAFLYGAAIVGQVISEGVYFAGQAVTSPIKGVRSAFKLGERMAGDNIAGKILGGALATVSLGITVAAYAFLLPLAAKTLGPVILSKMPTVISNAVTTVANALSPVMTAIGNVVMPVIGKAFTAIGMTVSPAAVGLAAAVGSVVTTIGTVASRAVDRFKNWWNNTSNTNAPKQTINNPSPFPGQSSTGIKKRLINGSPVQQREERQQSQPQSQPQRPRSAQVAKSAPVPVSIEQVQSQSHYRPGSFSHSAS